MFSSTDAFRRRETRSQTRERAIVFNLSSQNIISSDNFSMLSSSINRIIELSDDVQFENLMKSMILSFLMMSTFQLNTSQSSNLWFQIQIRFSIECLLRISVRVRHNEKTMFFRCRRIAMFLCLLLLSIQIRYLNKWKCVSKYWKSSQNSMTLRYFWSRQRRSVREIVVVVVITMINMKMRSRTSRNELRDSKSQIRKSVRIETIWETDCVIAKNISLSTLSIFKQKKWKQVDRRRSWWRQRKINDVAMLILNLRNRHKNNIKTTCWRCLTTRWFVSWTRLLSLRMSNNCLDRTLLRSINI